MDRRFDAFTTLMDRFMIWSLCTTVATGGIVIGALKVWLESFISSRALARF